MIQILLVALIVLWFLGYISIPWLNIPSFTVFTINGRPISAFELIILIVVLWDMTNLKSPFRHVALALIVLWLLSILGFIAISGLSNLLILAIIVGIAGSLFLK